MMVPIQITLIPMFVIFRMIGWINTFYPLTIPIIFANAYGVFLLRQFFMTLPDSLVESAKIDGANDFTILFAIFIPVAKATLAVMILFYAVAHWNSWFHAMLYLQSRSLYPLQLFLREILIGTASGGNVGLDSEMPFMEDLVRYCTIIVATVPILFIYPFAQKYFMTGVMLGSLKE